MKKKILILGLFMLLISPLIVSADAIDDYMSKIVKDGKVYLNTVIPTNADDSEGLLAYAFDQYSNKDYKVMGWCPEGESCQIQVSARDDSVFKEADIEIIYNSYDSELATKVSAYKSKFNIYENKFLILNDLDIINFIYNGGYGLESNIDLLNSIVNYSSVLKNLLGNGNIKATLDTRAGDMHNGFTQSVMGFLVLSHNNFAYTVINQVGFTANNILYIPESTANTTADFIAAAKLRLKNYLKEDIEITLGGTFAQVKADYYAFLAEGCEFEYSAHDCDYDFTQEPLFEIGEENLINKENSRDEYYIFKIKGQEYKFLIEKNNDKMVDGTLNTKDLNTGSMVYANSPLVPLDSQITYKELSKDSSEYKEILAKLKLTDGLMADISLFSNSKGANIIKLDNGNFKVYIPLTEAMQKQTLTAYYLNDDGTIEKYEVKIENGYAVFETNHFSTYTLGVSNLTATDNPQTSDNISRYLILGFISVIGIVGSRLYLKNKKVNN